MGEQGIIVGCDLKQEWLLPWWWKHYSAHNSYPVVFADFGMSQEAVSWCQERGIYQPPISLPQVSSNADLPLQIKEAWEDWYGKGIWNVRSAWLKKPFALLNSPFAFGIWLDLDCQVRGSLSDVFTYLHFGMDVGLIRDREQTFALSPEGEVNYSSGVIAFRQKAKILELWVEMIAAMENQLPGDQELLNRAIFVHKPQIFELPSIYNWYTSWAPNDQAIVLHYGGGRGKIEILKSLEPSYFCGIGIPKKWTPAS